MPSRVWEWRDDDRAKTVIHDIKELQRWGNVCREEGDEDEAWMYASQRGTAISVLRTLFGNKKADEIERLTR